MDTPDRPRAGAAAGFEVRFSARALIISGGFRGERFVGDRACGLGVGGRFAPPVRGCACVDLVARWAPPLFPGGSGCLDSLGGLGPRGCIWCAIRVFILAFSQHFVDAVLVRFRGLSWR